MLYFEYVNLSAMTFLIVELGKSMYSPTTAPMSGAEVMALAGAAVTPDATASSISALIILPPGPVPLTFVMSTP